MASGWLDPAEVDGRAGALSGIKVLEFSEIIAGPFGGMLLSDLGADVIKVEPPDGEAWRHQIGVFAPGENRSFMSLNRGKRGLAVDLKSPEGREIVLRLVPGADVVIVNYRPDTPAVLGIDYEALSRINPRLVYIEVTAFGTAGPNRHRPGYDIVAQAMTGLMTADAKTDDTGAPRPAAPAPADFATGFAVAWAACAGLFARERTGLGQKIEASLLASALGMLGASVLDMPDAPPAARDAIADRIRAAKEAGASFEELQEIRDDLMARAALANSYYRCYFTKDSVIAIAALSAALRHKVVAAVGIEDPRLTDPTLPTTGPEARGIAATVLALMENAMRERTTAEWLEVFDAAGVPAGPVRFPPELLDDPDVLANELLVDLDHAIAGPVRMVGPVIKMSATPTAARSASPALGQHTSEILGALGYSEEEISRLVDAGVVRARITVAD